MGKPVHGDEALCTGFLALAAAGRLLFFEVGGDASAELAEGDFAELRVVFGFEDALFGIEQALLRLAHFYSGEVAEEEAFAGDEVVLLCRDEVLAFEGEQLEVVVIRLPEVGQVGAQRLFQFQFREFGVFYVCQGVAPFALAVSVEELEA